MQADTDLSVPTPIRARSDGGPPSPTAGALPGVAANMAGLASIAAAEDRRADALATLDEAYAIAHAHRAQAIIGQIEQARAEI